MWRICLPMRFLPIWNQQGGSLPLLFLCHMMAFPLRYERYVSPVRRRIAVLSFCADNRSSIWKHLQDGQICIWGCYLKRDHSLLPTLCRMNFFKVSFAIVSSPIMPFSSLFSLVRDASTVDPAMFHCGCTSCNEFIPPFVYSRGCNIVLPADLRYCRRV